MPARLKELGAIEQSIYKVLFAQLGRSRREALIDYGTMGLAVNVPAKYLAMPLGEIVHWCRRHGLPALSALVVQKDTRIPGSGYYDAAHDVDFDADPGLAHKKWSAEVDLILAETRYPQPV